MTCVKELQVTLQNPGGTHKLEYLDSPLITAIWNAGINGEFVNKKASFLLWKMLGGRGFKITSKAQINFINHLL